MITDTEAYTAVLTAADPHDRATADEIPGGDGQLGEEGRQTVIARQRWETEGGALRHLDANPAKSPGEQQDPRCSTRDGMVSNPVAPKEAGGDKR